MENTNITQQMKLKLLSMIEQKTHDIPDLYYIQREEQEGIIHLIKEEFHLFLYLEDVHIQYSIRFEESEVCCLSFVHPVIVNDSNREQFILFLNFLNQYVKNMGRFCVDENDDIRYSVYVPYFLLKEYPEKIGEELIDVPATLYHDIGLPIRKLADGEWKVEKAIQYMEELYTNGFVYADDYE